MSEVTQEVAPKKTRTRAAKAVEVQAVEPRATSKQIGDKAPKAKVVDVTSITLGTVASVDVVRALHPINQPQLGGKKLGAMYVMGVGDAARLIVAQGNNLKSGWRTQGSGALTLPAGNLTPQGTIGDKRRVVIKNPVSAFEAPVVKVTDLGSGDASINIAALSGKCLGAMVVGDDGWIYLAEGSGPKAKWTKQDDAQTQITPSNPTVRPVSKLGDKPKARKDVVVAAMPVTQVEDTELIKKAADVNNAALSGKRAGALVFDTAAGGKSELFMAVGSADTSKWLRVTKSTPTFVTPV